MNRPDEARAQVAHELKTSLAVIVGYAELLTVRSDEETRREAPVRILEAAERLRDAIDVLVGALDADGRLPDEREADAPA